MSNFIMHIENDYASLSKKAAAIFAERVKLNPTGTFGFATGSTPVGMYNELTYLHKMGEVDLSKLTAFNLDEYCPIRKDDPQSYAYYMANNLFDKVGLPNEKRNIPNGEIDHTQARDSFVESLKDVTIDMQILGVGTNGHIGFNEPADSFQSDATYVPLAESTINDNARFFATIEEVPKHAITMGIRDIMMAKEILLLVSGSSKAEVLRELLESPIITPQIPITVLKLHQNVTIIADIDAAKNIKNKNKF